MRRFLWLVLALACTVTFFGPAVAQAQEEEGAGEAVRGSIVQRPEEGEPEPVEGVEIRISTAAGEEIGVATSDAEGNYLLELPGPGDYVAELNQESLPEGVGLTNPDRATLEFTVASGQQRPLLFPLGEGAARGGRRLGAFLSLLVSGITFGFIIAMAAVGLSLIFGTTGLVNFAHGDLVTFGALVAWWINVRGGIHLVPATILAVIVGIVGGLALNAGLWRPLRHRGTGLIAQLVISIGLGLALRYIYLIVFGGRTAPYAQYAVQRGLELGLVRVAPKDLVTIALSIVVLVGVALVLQKTKIGKAMRAVSDNADLAASSGINVERVIQFVWGFGAGLAALGGVLFGLNQQVHWEMGSLLLLLMFAGVTLGGLGTAYGALVGSLVIGIFVQTSTMIIPPEMKEVGGLLVLILVLLVRPQGILGRAERVG
ncbi:MAG: branched-chain amino acid ABC transporter permease [Nitriliruptorales bacterium]|nr:branched-chain amino acid ABC transporter permease [Nitriliruptorales bacterium]